MGGGKVAACEHTGRVPENQRAFAGNRTLNRWADGFQHAPRPFHWQIFVPRDGSLTLNWKGNLWPYQLSSPVA